jgi:hypothetical protein
MLITKDPVNRWVCEEVFSEPLVNARTSEAQKPPFHESPHCFKEEPQAAVLSFCCVFCNWNISSCLVITNRQIVRFQGSKAIWNFSENITTKRLSYHLDFSPSLFVLVSLLATSARLPV